MLLRIRSVIDFFSCTHCRLGKKRLYYGRESGIRNGKEKAERSRYNFAALNCQQNNQELSHFYFFPFFFFFFCFCPSCFLCYFASLQTQANPLRKKCALRSVVHCEGPILKHNGKYGCTKKFVLAALLKKKA